MSAANETVQTRYALHRIVSWRHRETGATASIFGACPWTSEHDRPNWHKESCGWGYYDSRRGTYHGKHGTSLDDAIALVNRLNGVTP